MRIPNAIVALTAILAASTTYTDARPMSAPVDDVYHPRGGSTLQLAPSNSNLRPAAAPAQASAQAGSSLGQRMLSYINGGIAPPTRRQQEERRRRSLSAASQPRIKAGKKKVRRAKAVKRCDTAPATSTKATSTAAKTTSTAAPKTTSTSQKASSTTASSAKPAATTAASRKMVSAGYWTEWSLSSVPPENIDWSKFDFINYAFAVPQSDGSISFTDNSSKTSLRRLVAAGHKAGKKVVLSLGGWGQSKGFSGAVSTDARRKTFVNSLKTLQSTYDLDGFDFDWEYPNNVQGGPNSPQDTANFQTFIQAARAGLPAGQILSAAVPQVPWLASNGSPVGSVARAASALDYIVLMNYDVWGSSGTPGPNAPLANLCGNSTQPAASAAAGVKQWAAVGMPRSKILLGIPSYGYVSRSSARKLIQRDTENLQRRAATVTSSTGSTTEGQINFSSLVKQGALKKNSKGTYVAGTGWTKYWDNCSDTPYLANGGSVITYDDKDSLADKGSFALQAGIAGVNMWSLDGDTSGWDLISAARAGMGLK